MKTYTVHAPAGDIQSHADRVAFVRDGFSIFAFVFGPLWILYHRMWLVLIGYLVVIGLCEGALHLLGIDGSAGAIVSILLGLLLGLEGSTLRRWTLARRGMRQVATIVARDMEEAESRFFSGLAQGSHASTSTRTDKPASAPSPNAPATGDVLGSFPSPQGALR